MGSASNGPLLAGLENQGGLQESATVVCLDPQTFKEIVYPSGDNRTLSRIMNFKCSSTVFRISANGRVISWWNPGSSPSGLQTIVRNGNAINSYYEHKSVGYTLPGPDGQTLFTVGCLYTATLKPLGEQVGGDGKMVWYLPAEHGNYYMSLNEVKQDSGNKSTLSLSVHALGDSKPLATLPNLSGLEGLVDWNTRRTQSFDRHVHLIPDAQLIVILPITNDKLIFTGSIPKRSLRPAPIPSRSWLRRRLNPIPSRQ